MAGEIYRINCILIRLVSVEKDSLGHTTSEATARDCLNWTTHRGSKVRKYFGGVFSHHTIARDATSPYLLFA